MTQPDPARELATEFRILNDHLHTGGDVAGAMQRLVDLACVSVPGCTWAATTAWTVGRRPHTQSYVGDVALSVDQLQYDLGDGPCLLAAEDSGPVLGSDLATETRWPAFCRSVLIDTPVRGVLSYQLVGEPNRLALNLYADRAGAFDTEALDIGVLFAAHAAVLAAHAESASSAVNLTNALSTSRQIGTAIGILMAAHDVSEERAFVMLRATSQRFNRKLRDVAKDVTDTGELPTRHRPV